MEMETPSSSNGPGNQHLLMRFCYFPFRGIEWRESPGLALECPASSPYDFSRFPTAAPVNRLELLTGSLRT